MSKMNRCFFYLSIFLLSCENEEEASLYQIRGRVSYDSKSISNVNVSIDNISSLTTATSEDGSFVINNVHPGDHTLVISKLIIDKSTSALTEKSYRVQVSGDVELNNLKLPEAVFISDAFATESSISLKWSQTDDVEFREYKVYRHSTSGLDETTGSLVHISTSISDTSYIDKNLIPNRAYFYRVYVMDDFGRIGGSNIVTAKTEAKELIIDGSFESLTGMDETQANWRFYGCPLNEWQLNQQAAFHGINSIEIRTVADGNCGLYFESEHPIAIGDLSPGQKLRLTFQYKGASSNITLGLYGILTQNRLFGIVGSDSEWKTYSRDVFVSQELNEFNLKFVIEIDPAFLAGTTLLVDNISLKAID